MVLECELFVVTQICGGVDERQRLIVICIESCFGVSYLFCSFVLIELLCLCSYFGEEINRGDVCRFNSRYVGSLVESVAYCTLEIVKIGFDILLLIVGEISVIVGGVDRFVVFFVYVVLDPGSCGYKIELCGRLGENCRDL